MNKELLKQAMDALYLVQPGAGYSEAREIIRKIKHELEKPLDTESEKLKEARDDLK